jgi:deoxyribonuclease-4
MKFGFHVSIQGGLHRAPERARSLGCDCLQIFSASPRSWGIKTLAAEEVRLFRENMSRYALGPCVVHTPYLLNLCAEDAVLLERSRKALLEELRRAEQLGAEYVVVHMGTRKSNTETAALDLMARSIDRVLRRFGADNRDPAAAQPGVTLLLENTSGGGGKLGYCIPHLAAVLKKAETGRRVGICLDTAHLFQAGYDIRTRHGLRRTIRELESCIGTETLRLIHLNDSLTPLGSGHDRHWHIGRGHIGRAGFRRIMHQPLFSRLPAIMETPKKSDEDDKQNMRAARRLAASNPAEKILQYIFCNKN